MEKIKLSKTAVGAAALMIFAAFAALSGLAFLFHVDNKYTANAGIAQEGVTVLPTDEVRFLVNGWELYPDQLLTPDDFREGTPSPRYTVWAGEYPNLSLFHGDDDPYGAATYRLRLQGEGTATLYLQEPLCAARVFAGGRDLGPFHTHCP